MPAIPAIAAGAAVAGAGASAYGASQAGGSSTQSPVTTSKRLTAGKYMEMMYKPIMVGQDVAAPGGGTYKFQLPPALQQALNSIQGMISYGTTGQIDQATGMANAQMRSLSQGFAERGVSGGQQTMMEQQTRDNLISSILGAQRQGAQQYGQAESAAWQTTYSDAINAVRMMASGGGAPVTTPNMFGQNLMNIGGQLSNAAGAVYGAYQQQAPQQPQYVNPTASLDSSQSWSDMMGYSQLTPSYQQQGTAYGKYTGGRM